MSARSLVVDDSVSMRRMVAFTLTQAGFVVIEAENGEAALGLLEEVGVELIITDVNMPVMDGFHFVREVRRRRGYAHTPILMLTTDCEQERKAEGRLAGATGWIVKPFDPERLLEVVRQLLPREAA